MSNNTEALIADMKTAANKAKQANELYLEKKITLSECAIEIKDYLEYSDDPKNMLAVIAALEQAQQELIKPLAIGELIQRLENQTGEPWGKKFLEGFDISAKLPEKVPVYADDGLQQMLINNTHNAAIDACAEAIRAAGGTVKVGE